MSKITEDVTPAPVGSTVGSAVCAFCAGTGWRKYDHNHAKVCEHCCKHDKGWWELTEHHAGYVAGKDNACCRAGCGTMRRDLSNDQGEARRK